MRHIIKIAVSWDNSFEKEEMHKLFPLFAKQVMVLHLGTESVKVCTN